MLDLETMTNNPSNTDNHATKFVPKDFSGRLRAVLKNVFRNTDGTFSFVFKVIEHGPYYGMRTRTYLDMSNPRRRGYYEKLFEAFDQELNPENIETLTGRQFELRYSFNETENGDIRQNIWHDRCRNELVPPVQVEINGNTHWVKFDSNSRGLPYGAKTGFKLWLALMAWSRRRMRSGGWPASGEFIYPNPLQVEVPEQAN